MPAVRRLVLASCVLIGACSPLPYNPERATRLYPRARHSPQGVVDIQVFRDDESITLVNATGTSYPACSIWLNQRYVSTMPALPAGATVEVPLDGFWDHWGGSPERGGLLRRFEPTPIRLAELDVDPDSALVGLVVISAEQPKAPKTLQG